jgi:hypothetical protein
MAPEEAPMAMLDSFWSRGSTDVTGSFHGCMGRFVLKGVTRRIIIRRSRR